MRRLCLTAGLLSEGVAGDLLRQEEVRRQYTATSEDNTGHRTRRVS